MSGAPIGYRYVSVREGGGQARFEPVAEQARVVQQIFAWIAIDRCSLSEVCRRFQTGGELTATGKRIWSGEAVWHVLQNPAYMGQAAYGKTHMMARSKNSRLRAARGRPAEPRRCNAPVVTDPKEWIHVPVPPLVDAALFRAAQAQLEENRSRARQGRRRPWLSPPRTHVLRKVRICILRQDNSSIRGRPTNERFHLLPMRWIRRLPVWWRSDL
jgi:site-specific DNA recombinase